MKDTEEEKRTPYERRVWTLNEAQDYLENASKKKLPKGLTYWSAMDFLKNPRPNKASK